ncbi:MAG: hypothetical protein AAFP98_13140 [Pseudomonadota bacterium]
MFDYGYLMISAKHLLSLVFMLLPTVAPAQMSDLSCDDSDRLNERLVDILGATRQSFGLRDPETLLEVWVMPRNSEWFIVQNYANGTSCIVAIGEHWQEDNAGPA